MVCTASQAAVRFCLLRRFGYGVDAVAVAFAFAVVPIILKQTPQKANLVQGKA